MHAPHRCTSIAEVLSTMASRFTVPRPEVPTVTPRWSERALKWLRLKTSKRSLIYITSADLEFIVEDYASMASMSLRLQSQRSRRSVSRI